MHKTPCSSVTTQRRHRTEPFNVDDVLKLLLAPKNFSSSHYQVLPESLIFGLIHEAKSVFEKQPMVLDLSTDLQICGDIHGQYQDLLHLFRRFGFPDTHNYLFLGDYVDRGTQSIPTICLLFAYKVKFPENFFLIRGNHECPSMNAIFGFLAECCQFYSKDLWEAFNDCFDYLPIAAVIEEKILCVHGGISATTNSLETIRDIARPCTENSSQLVRDILWNDPSPNLPTETGLQNVTNISGDVEKYLMDVPQPDFTQNFHRGSSFYFSEHALAKFLSSNDLELLVRGHQTVMRGYSVTSGRKCVTVFSAPNYCGNTLNKGGVMFINAEMHCSFKTFHHMAYSRDTKTRTAALEARQHMDINDQDDTSFQTPNTVPTPPPTR
ncbi:putative Serine/threonine-protein phosphatase [Blattamonas nauphoetae]|uniref:Serine/threonine-protein phosphatase n=1 Tax=Blattamonas nauphoetae TaxID=2049346 RepID=A0ABQ9XZH9_9EUKA|nr:putative Serine/threonine-protein phosphatase [Blattamonas nauphoetae]